MSKPIKFFLESLLRLREIGTFLPTSGYSGKIMACDVKRYPNGKIIELGSGTGAVTKSILESMNKNNRLYCFETNPKFCEELREIADYRNSVIEDSAENIDRHLIENVQMIISVLPLANMEIRTKRRILERAHCVLQPGGRFVQLQYLPLDRKLVGEYFPIEKTKISFWNPPPAFIYTGLKKEFN